MLYYIEHSGSEEHNKAVKEIRDIIEDEFGASVEFIIGDSRSPIIIYDANMNPLYQSEGGVNKEILKFYLHYGDE